MMVHPGNRNVLATRTLACAAYEIRYRGRSAHASAVPWEGVNALDAMTIANTAIGLARQQLEPDQQVHGIVVSGGTAANVIPEESAGTWIVRAETMESLGRVAQTLRRCFEAGALATGATLDMMQRGNPYADMRSDPDMERYFHANAAALGRTMSLDGGKPAGSTDMANVSHYFPTIHPMISLGEGTPTIHHPEFAEYAAGPAGDIAVREAGLAMAWTVVDLATDLEQRRILLAHRGPDPRQAVAHV
jgi:metal-dependent amidase/aminoacylase/carboxypeptidase family protein